MGTRLKADIQSGVLDELPVMLTNTVKGIYLSMRLPCTDMVAFAYDAVAIDNNGTHHRIGTGILATHACQLKASRHIEFVSIHHCKSKQKLYKYKIF